MISATTCKGKPNLTYEDQNVPAPIKMSPLELLNNAKFRLLLSHEDDMTVVLKPSKFVSHILRQEPPTSQPFDINQMDETSGEQSQKYLQLLQKNTIYKGFWQFLSTNRSLKQSFMVHGPLTQQMSKHLDHIKATRKLELFNARALQEAIVRTWNPNVDKEAETYILSASMWDEKTMKNTGKIMVEFLVSVGLLQLKDEGTIEIANDYKSRSYFLCIDAYSADNIYSFERALESSIGY